MIELNLELGERSYPIYIGADLLADEQLYLSHIDAHQVAIVSNITVAPLYLERLKRALSQFSVVSIVLPDGESHKTLTNVEHIITRLLEEKYSRDCTLVALGGGVIGDITGFAAACYLRGVNIIQVPTTLLAQVDSSVGGKTGVNHPLGKNMIGAFYQPRCVVADTGSLDTLPDRELKAGIAEVIKYGLIRDPGFFDWLEVHMQALLAREPVALAEAIKRSCENKADVVQADERESGQRALLNLGHTFGHAIEAGMGYGNWLHGEAVAAGMCMAIRMSSALGWLSRDDQDRATGLIAAAGLPVQPPAELTSDQMLKIMAVDKKVLKGQLRLVLLNGIGSAVLTADYDEATLARTLTAA
ncbi:MAG: 3-dehydroquinate synthase [Gammaproteobacteria bacterium]|nr:MAG: 3-dehydroquinate synthase [Gammaproteobacteria bacterium]